MFVTARNRVEQRCLAAVRIAHQRHANRVAARTDQFVYRVVARNRFDRSVPLRRLEQFVRFAVRKYLYHFRFAAAQRYVVAHDPVLNRVLERRVQDHLHPLAADESHFHDPAAEPSVAQYFQNRRRFSGFQFGQSHIEEFFMQHFLVPKLLLLSRSRNPHFSVFRPRPAKSRAGSPRPASYSVNDSQSASLRKGATGSPAASNRLPVAPSLKQ